MLRNSNCNAELKIIGLRIQPQRVKAAAPSIRVITIPTPGEQPFWTLARRMWTPAVHASEIAVCCPRPTPAHSFLPDRRPHLTAGSPPHVLVQKSEDVGFPDAYPKVKKIVTIVERLSDGRIELQAMRFAGLFAAGVQHLAGRERVVVLGMDEEDGSRDMVNGGKEAALATPGKDQSYSQRLRRR